MWLCFLTFATIKAKGRHYSSKTRKNFFPCKFWLGLLHFFIYFFLRSVFTMLNAPRFDEESSPEEIKVFLTYNFGVQCTFICMHTCCCRSVVLLNLFLLSCMHWFPPVNSSFLQFIYLNIGGLYVSSLLKVPMIKDVI